MSWEGDEYQVALAVVHHFRALGRIKNHKVLLDAVKAAFPAMMEAMLHERMTWEALCKDAKERFSVDLTISDLMGRRVPDHRFRDAVRWHLSQEHGRTVH